MYLYGASGHAKVIIDILKSSDIRISGLFDDNADLKILLGYPVLGKFSLDILNEEELIVSIGSNAIRRKVVELLPGQIKYGQAVFSSAVISEYSKVAEGTVIMHGAIIQSCTRIGKHCIINTGSSVDHDCMIEDFVHISPNACLCGGVTVGEGTQIGAGAVVIPEIRIGKWSVAAAGSVIIHDVPDHVVVAGNPARIINNNFQTNE